MLLKLSVRSAGSEFQMVGAAWQNMRLPTQSWPQRHEGDSSRWSGDDVMTFGIEVGRICR